MNNGIVDSSKEILKIMAVGVSDSKIYTAVFGIGVFVSTDTCKNWRLINNGLPLNYNDGGLAYITVFAFGFLDNYIFITSGHGVYFSTNGGIKWETTEADTSITCREGLATIGDIILIGNGYISEYLTSTTRENLGLYLQAPNYYTDDVLDNIEIL